MSDTFWRLGWVCFPHLLNEEVECAYILEGEAVEQAAQGISFPGGFQEEAE